MAAKMRDGAAAGPSSSDVEASRSEKLDERASSSVSSGSLDEFFDDEQELMAEATSAMDAQDDAPDNDGATADGSDSGDAQPTRGRRRAAGSAHERTSRVQEKAPRDVSAKDATGRQAPPFWMVLAIAGVALALGIVIGYLIGSATTLAEMSAAGDAASSEGTSSVQMPEGHPNVSVDENGNATVDEDGEDASDAGDAASNEGSSDSLTRANAYFDQGMAALNASSDEASQAKAVEFFTQAIAAYDEYLAGHESASATVDRAICVFYSGDHEGAIADLEEFVASDATFAPAWANLGMFYESHDERDKAIDAYEQALKAAEQDDTYGVKDYAQQRLDALNDA